MGAGTWQIGGKAKKYICNNTITMGVGVFKMCLVTTAGSAALSAIKAGARSTWASVGSEVTGGGYAAGGKNLVPATAKWTAGASTNSWKFTYSTVGLVFTANGSSIVNIRYAVIRNSTGAGAGKVLCYAALTTTQFTLASPNTLTILPAATGVFTLT
jgi:hypothetical protein